MTKNSEMKKCSIDLKQKNGKTRLSLNQQEVLDYLKDCVIENEDKELQFTNMYKLA